MKADLTSVRVALDSLRGVTALLPPGTPGVSEFIDAVTTAWEEHLMAAHDAALLAPKPPHPDVAALSPEEYQRHVRRRLDSWSYADRLAPPPLSGDATDD